MHSISQYADLIGVSRQYVHRMIVRGRLHAIRVGRAWIVPQGAKIAKARNPGPPSKIK